MDEEYWKRLQQKIQEQGFEGKGKFERYMEKIVEDVVIFMQSDGEITITAKK